MNAPTTASLLFNWDPLRGRNLAISGFLITSLAAHAACFYLFQVVYPPTVSLTPAPQRVNLISANSEQGATLLRRIDAEDPALASTTRRPSDVKRYLFGKVEQIPSYFASEPALQAAPPLIADLRVPSAQLPGPVPAPRRVPPKPVGVAPTKVTFSNELDRLGQAKVVPTKFMASGHEPPQNSQFRIAVDGWGAVRYCFVLISSGDAGLDEQARGHLALCRFPPRAATEGESLVWGIATIEWGNDVAAASAKSTSTAP